jgi:peptide/nickel transport system permease protein
LNPFLLKRAATYLLVLAVALLINFFLPRAIPGNPLEELTGGIGDLPVAIDARAMEALRSYYGLDRPISTQFADYLTGLVRGDLGYSISYRMPVTPLLLNRLPWTLLLTLVALSLSFAAALVLGTGSGRGHRGEMRVLVPAVFLHGMPPFVLGSLLLLAFAVKVPILPLSGAYSPFVDSNAAARAWDVARHGILPVVVLAASCFFPAYLVVRNSVIMIKNEPYLLMAEAKGLPERTIRYRYLLRNALLPVVTFFGARLAASAGASILVEVLFAYPGVGRLSYEAVLSHDYPLLQGTFLTFTLWVLLINFCTDCLYVSLDPRVKEV